MPALFGALGGVAVILVAAALAPLRPLQIGAHAFSIGRMLPLGLLVLLADLASLELVQGAATPALVLSAAGLLMVGEVGSWSQSLCSVTLVDRSIVARRAGDLTAIGACAIALAAATAGASRVPFPSGLGAAVIGVVATIGAVAVVAVLARGNRDRPADPGEPSRH